MTSRQADLIFVDATGGGLAALAAGVARKLGHAGALAATTSDAITVPPEVALVLREIDADLPPVQRAEEIAAIAGPRIDPSAFAYPLYDGDGDMERRAAARIARDRIERHLETEGVPT
jgi:hypothetical protein